MKSMPLKLNIEFINNGILLESQIGKEYERRFYQFFEFTQATHTILNKFVHMRSLLDKAMQTELTNESDAKIAQTFKE